MTSAVTVRSVLAADRDAVGRLGALLVAEHHEFDRKRFIAPVSNLAELYGSFLVAQAERPDAIVLVAERDGALVGYAFGAVEGNDYMVLRGPAGELYDLVVDPGHRRQGVGTVLLDAALAALAALGAPRVVLFTAEKNEVAKQMFERAGFRRTMVEMTREVAGR
jgi:ribosomal protein S18 acetylase RimI-like enzyme